MKTLLLAALLVSSSAFAQTTSYECKFPMYASLEGLKKDPDFKLTFMFDKATYKAYMVGNTGSTEVSIIPNGSGITFLETSAVGNVFTTTITNDGMAVHSRNTIILKDLSPTQYYGKCVIKH